MGPEEQIITVAEFDRRLKHVVERVPATAWVQGEVSSLRIATSGHCYFTLKDEKEDAVIDCVLYRLAAQRARVQLVDGAKIQILGRPTFWAPRGRLQFVGEQVRLAGRGALLLALEQLKERLTREGLFAPERKKPLPAQPRVIGVVTSRQGAVWHDIQVVAGRRAPVRLVLSPSLVQGDGAAQNIIRALDLIERLPELDVVILARGGGSFEDLMPFNDERVVRRVAACRVPVVSAVGHETDTTLCDWAADARAATPSQAAEMLVPDQAVSLERVERLGSRLKRAMKHALRNERAELVAVRVKLSDPRFAIAEKQQSLDDLSLRLERRARRTLTLLRQGLNNFGHRLSAVHPRASLLRARLRFEPLEARLNVAARQRLTSESRKLSTLAVQLDALSPLSVLSRGYGIALTAEGRVLRDANQVNIGDRVHMRLAQGVVLARVEGTEVAK